MPVLSFVFRLSVTFRLVMAMDGNVDRRFLPTIDGKSISSMIMILSGIYLSPFFSRYCHTLIYLTSHDIQELKIKDRSNCLNTSIHRLQQNSIRIKSHQSLHSLRQHINPKMPLLPIHILRIPVRALSPMIYSISPINIPTTLPPSHSELLTVP